MSVCIKDPLFWYAISWMKMHLKPPAFAANLTQATLCRINTVLLTFGFLMMQYKSMLEPEDVGAVVAIIGSIEWRWEKCDQEIFIAAIVLNLFYKTTPFSHIPELNNTNICTLLECLYAHFFQYEPPSEFDNQLSHYLQDTGEFQNLNVRCRQAEASTNLKV
ncbi:hypothetical protein PAXRUDRAFT_767640 [Paxillus rubicundulus Ve08.2h10]|uniref:Uncharacterized protein n=1 Tax=Paxillus rubicundulus Ve08.2h10 TaxID=930991 RepID=A0A0D0DGI3_9AGAM|nr:hypothetical protein PAXRUDRAFT_767640 [Paxillus rubicundulus Ve08.2h10]